LAVLVTVLAEVVVVEEVVRVEGDER